MYKLSSILEWAIKTSLLRIKLLNEAESVPVVICAFNAAWQRPNAFAKEWVTTEVSQISGTVIFLRFLLEVCVILEQTLKL